MFPDLCPSSVLDQLMCIADWIDDGNGWMMVVGPCESGMDDKVAYMIGDGCIMGVARWWLGMYDRDGWMEDGNGWMDDFDGWMTGMSG